MELFVLACLVSRSRETGTLEFLSGINEYSGMDYK